MIWTEWGGGGKSQINTSPTLRWAWLWSGFHANKPFAVHSLILDKGKYTISGGEEGVFEVGTAGLILMTIPGQTNQCMTPKKKKQTDVVERRKTG